MLFQASSQMSRAMSCFAWSMASGVSSRLKRYAKRGGANKEYYQKLAKAGYLKPGPKGAVRLSKPMW